MRLLDFLFLSKQTLRLRSSRTTGDFTAARKDFAVQSDDFYGLIVFFENTDCVVDVVYDNRTAQKRLYESVEFLVVFDEVACKSVAARLGEYAPILTRKRTRTAGRERSERNAAVTLLFQIIDEVARVALGFNKHVLHCAAQSVFDCRFEVGGNVDDFSQNAPDFRGKHGIVSAILHKAFDGFLITRILVFDGSVKIEVALRQTEFGVEVDDVFLIALNRLLVFQLCGKCLVVLAH